MSTAAAAAAARLHHHGQGALLYFSRRQLGGEGGRGRCGPGTEPHSQAKECRARLLEGQVRERAVRGRERAEQGQTGQLRAQIRVS